MFIRYLFLYLFLVVGQMRANFNSQTVTTETTVLHSPYLKRVTR